MFRTDSQVNKPLYLILFLILGSCINGFGQNQNGVTISGKVVDDKSEPIPGLSVYIKGLNKGDVTDVDGRYKIENISSDTAFHLTVSGIGYQTQAKEIKPGGSTDLTVNFEMKKGQYNLSEFNVVGKSNAEELRETGYNVNVLETKELKNLSTDINQVLQTTSGVNIREAGGLGSGFRLSLNGLSGNQVRYFIDGIPMESFGSSLSLNNYPVNLIDNIEVYKGVVPISLGADALGGAINITSAYRKKSFLDVGYTVGSFNTHRGSINGQYANKEKGYFARVTSFINYSDNNFKMYDVPLYDLELGNYEGDIDVRRKHSEYSSGMVKAEVGLFDKKFADRISLSFTKSLNRKNYQHPDNNIKRVFGHFYSKNNTTLLSATYEKRFGKLAVKAYALGGQIIEEVIDTSAYKYNWAGESIRRDEDDQRGELYDRRSWLEITDKVFRSSAQAIYSIDQNHELATSYSQNYTTRSGTDHVDEFSTSFQSPSYINKTILGGSYIYKPNSERWEVSVFVKEYLYSGNIVTTDSQDEEIEENIDLNNTGYGFTSRYFAGEHFQFKASFERALRLPESHEILGDGIYVNPNPQLLPENSYNGNLGLRFQTPIAENWDFRSDLNTFIRSSNDFIRFRPMGPFGQYENISNVRSTGIEGGFEIRYNSFASLNANATYQNITDQTRKDEGLENVNYNSKIPNIPYFFANARFGIKPFHKKTDGNLSFYWSTRYVHEFFLTWENLGSAESKHVIPSQLTHDLEAEYSLKDGKYNFSLSVNNLTNNIVYDNFRIQKPGRAIYFKIRYLLQ